MISSLIQKIARAIFSIKYDFSLTRAELPESYNFELSSNTVDNLSDIPRNSSNKVTNAAYGNRFAIIPFDYFTAIFYGKNPEQLDKNQKEMIELSNENNLIQKRLKISEFVTEFENWCSRFVNSFENQKNKDNVALSVLREEIFHNQHLSNTTTWAISQVLTLAYRFCTTYLVYYRYKLGSILPNSNKHLLITQYLLNTYFIRQLIAKFTTPIVESYFHFQDNDLNGIGETYGKLTKKLCEDYLILYNHLKINYPENVDKIIEHISKTVLDYPFAFQIVNYTGVDYLKFQEFYTMIPEKRFKNLIKYILGNNFSSADELINKITSFFNKTSKFEKKFASSLLFYATKIVIPSQLVLFMLKQVFVTNYRKVLIYYIKELFSGAKKMDSSYVNMPAIRSFGLNDQFFNIDPAMNLFTDGVAFVIAQNSLEPTLAGDDGYTDIVHSKRCVSLLVQTILLKAIYFVCETQLTREDFIKDYSLSFRARPYLLSHKHVIENEFLPMVYDIAFQSFVSYYMTNFPIRNPFDLNFARKFELKINELVLYVESKDDSAKIKLLTFCELNYAHGF